SDYMKKLVDELLFLARGEMGRNPFEPKPLSLTALIRDVYCSRSVRTYFICFVLLSCCSIFKDQFASACAATCSLYHIRLHLSRLFCIFFKKSFQVLDFSSSRTRAYIFYHFLGILSSLF
ncbi:MAG: hypothetical protein IIX80_00425, partial [Clostridia bacterium]|nr:hypothetical protein [Clostridia bacterium]